jgi:hypothetical protein
MKFKFIHMILFKRISYCQYTIHVGLSLWLIWCALPQHERAVRVRSLHDGWNGGCCGANALWGVLLLVHHICVTRIVPTV